jgi:hypothetical protein
MRRGSDGMPDGDYGLVACPFFDSPHLEASLWW